MSVHAKRAASILAVLAVVAILRLVYWDRSSESGALSDHVFAVVWAFLGTVSDLRAAYRVSWVSPGEGRVYMRVEELGASFELDQSGPRAPQLALIKDPAAVPGDVKIIGILLTTAA